MSTGSNLQAAPYSLFHAGEALKSRGWCVGFNSPTALAGFLVCVGYYLGAKIGFTLTFQPHPVSTLWPPNSILLAALLLTPVRAWWFLILAALPAHLAVQMQGGVPPSMILCWFVSNSCEALIGAALTRLLIGGPMRFDKLRNVGVFCACAAFMGPFLSSFLDAAFVGWNGWGQGPYWELWRIRFTSNVLAALTVAPVIVTCMTKGITRRKPSRWRSFEVVILFASLLWVSYSFLYKSGSGSNPALFYTPVPLLLWAAMRFGSRGASAAVLVVAFLAVWGAAHLRGPFSAGSPEQNALSTQMFLIVISVPLMFLAAVTEERANVEERFVKAFLSGPDAMVIARLKDGHIIEVNERCEALFGYPRDEAIGRKMFDFNIYTSEADRQKLIAAAFAGKVLRDLEVCLRTRAGELRYVLVSAEIEDISGEPSAIIIIRDITDRKRAEEANQKLAHISRLAMVGELTASIAHEINQPLGAILSNADAAELLLESHPEQLDEVKQILADIRKDDLRASHVIRQMRALLGRHEMEMLAIDLCEVVSEVERLVSLDARRRNVVLDINLSGPTVVQGDRIHLQQVFLNLILNGMDAMNDTLKADRRLTISVGRNANGMVEASVTDAGVGIPQERFPKLFESFSTTKKEGMGLGLSIARSIIEAHHGKIWAENNPIAGATFRFSLPQVSEKG